MSIVALQTARKGSKSILNKNIYEFKGKPFFLHNILEAQQCNLIDEVFISTDIPMVFDLEPQYGYKTIVRPEELAGDHASHYDAMAHGLKEIENRLQKEVDLLVILLGNSLGAKADDLTKAMEMLQNNENASSVQSVTAFNMFNPFRAYKLEENGFLNTIMPQQLIVENAKLKNINDKKAAGDSYFFNGSFWIIKKSTFMANDGLNPFTWLGNNILPYAQDMYMEIDALWQLEYYINKFEKNNSDVLS